MSKGMQIHGCASLITGFLPLPFLPQPSLPFLPLPSACLASNISPAHALLPAHAMQVHASLPSQAHAQLPGGSQGSIPPATEVEKVGSVEHISRP
eukprot:1157525-Pelagomonas_calceolata.AAC.9